MTGKVHYEVGQTALSIICDEAYLPVVRNAVHDARSIVESKISEDPFFATTFDPIPADPCDHSLVQRMCQSSESSNVGPMAGVAGAIATYAVDSAVEAGCEHIVVDNGGDICLRISEPVIIGMFSGDEKFRNIGFRIDPDSNITGICSSSGRVGPSISLGNSGICTVFSDDAILADCCATAFGNMIVEGTSEEMTQAAERIASVEGVVGCICVCNGRVAMCGTLPEMVRTDGSESNVTSILL